MKFKIRLALLQMCILWAAGCTVPAQIQRQVASSSQPAASPSASASSSSQQAARSSDFLDSVGVVTHFGYTDTNYYNQPAKTIAAIQQLGVRHVRDGISYGWVAPNLYAIFAQLAAANIHPDLLLPNPGPTAAEIENLLPHYPGADAVEGPNEYDHTESANWAAQLRAYLPTVMQVGRDVNLPVIGPSLTLPASYPELGDVAPYINFSNIHAYWGGRNPETQGWGPPDAHGALYGSFAYDLDQVQTTGPGKPVMITETGYVVTNTPTINEIPEAVEAIYEPRLLLHAWNEGIQRTYIYELMDDPSSLPGFGLMHADLTPRPAYLALQTLLHLLADAPGNQTPGKLAYSLGGANGLESTLLQKQDGSFWLAVWNPGCIYDVNNLVPTPIASTQVSLSVAGGRQVVAVWTFNGAGGADEVAVNKSTASITVGSAVTLVEIQ